MIPKHFLLTFLMIAANSAGTRILVDPKGKSVDAVRSSLRSHGLQEKRFPRPVGSTGFMLIDIEDHGTIPDIGQIKTMLAKDNIYAEEDVLMSASVVPNDSGYANLWAMPKVQAPVAWDTFTGNNSIKVCIIDSGIENAHNDLSPNIASQGYNAITNSYGCIDDNGHGTHCAGTIGAKGNNNIGVSGVSWNVDIIGCKFLGADGSGYTSDAIECLTYCRSQGAKITSNSWGGGGFSQALYNEIAAEQAAGNLFVVAAGNENRNIDNQPSYPASYDLANIISVGSTTQLDDKSSFSNYGSISVDLMAPGSSIYSTYIGNTYTWLSGTSMATPHVAGAAALIWQYNSNLTAREVKDTLMRTVDTTKILRPYCVSGGRINVLKALNAVRTPFPPSPPPSQLQCCKFNKQGICQRLCRKLNT